MEDFMDELIARVGRGSEKAPMRREALPEDLLEEIPMAQAALGNVEGRESRQEELRQHIHRESVRCYRNTQAVLLSETESLKELVRAETASGAEEMKALLRQESEALKEELRRELSEKRPDRTGPLLILSLILGILNFFLLTGLIARLVFGIAL